MLLVFIFSILANEFKTDDIKTIEELFEMILNSPIEPKPVCNEVDYIFGWKEYISPLLADPPLKNHSLYHSFSINKEEGVVKFRAKKLPQDKEYVPRAGIRIVREGVEFNPVGAAEFRVHSIPFDRINRTIRIMTSRLSLTCKMKVQESWDRMRDNLEALPRRIHLLEKMDLSKFPKDDFSAENVSHPLLQSSEEVEEISGDLMEEHVEEGDLDEICEDIDVCVYSDETTGRPWVGRIRQMLPGSRFVIQWFSRRSGRGLHFTAMTLNNGEPYLSELDMESIMFWAMTEDRKADSFKLSNYWLEVIRKEYEHLDR